MSKYWNELLRVIDGLVTHVEAISSETRPEHLLLTVDDKL